MHVVLSMGSSAVASRPVEMELDTILSVSLRAFLGL